jgi:hypothetical protein
VIKYNDLPDTPFPRELHRGHDWFANWEWVHALASRPDIFSWITPTSMVVLLAFALGAFARFSYIAFLVLLSVHVLVVLQHKSAHDWGLPLVALWGLAVVPWSEGIGVDRWRGSAQPERDYGFAVWFPGLMIGLAFLAAAYAKLDSSGLEWVTGGAVKYHFIEDSRQAPTTWGLWVAAHHPVAVLMSAAAILIEGTFIIHVFFRSLWVRAAFGVAGLALLVGFRVLQGVVWTQWWVLFLCFVPWQVIAHRLWRRAARGVPARPMTSSLGREAIAVTMLMIVVQAFASAHRFEAEPFVSDYGMYSWTWPSRDAFDRQMSRKYRRYRYREWTAGRTGEDISDSLSALPKAMDVLADATDRLRDGEQLGDAQREALAAIASAYRETYGRSMDAVAVHVSEQAFDWSSGRFRLTAGNERVGVLDLAAGRLMEPGSSRVADRQ